MKIFSKRIIKEAIILRKILSFYFAINCCLLISLCLSSILFFSFEKNSLNDIDEIILSQEYYFLEKKPQELFSKIKNTKSLISIDSLHGYSYNFEEDGDNTPSIKINNKQIPLNTEYYSIEENGEIKYYEPDEYFNLGLNGGVYNFPSGGFFVYNDYFNSLYNDENNSNVIFLSEFLFQKHNLKDGDKASFSTLKGESKEVFIKKMNNQFNFSFIYNVDYINEEHVDECFINVFVFKFEEYLKICEDMTSFFGLDVSDHYIEEVIRTTLIIEIFIFILILGNVIIFFSVSSKINSKICELRKETIAINRTLGEPEISVLLRYFVIMFIPFSCASLIAVTVILLIKNNLERIFSNLLDIDYIFYNFNLIIFGLLFFSTFILLSNTFIVLKKELNKKGVYKINRGVE